MPPEQTLSDRPETMAIGARDVAAGRDGVRCALSTIAAQRREGV